MTQTPAPRWQFLLVPLLPTSGYHLPVPFIHSLVHYVYSEPGRPTPYRFGVATCPADEFTPFPPPAELPKGYVTYPHSQEIDVDLEYLARLGLLKRLQEDASTPPRYALTTTAAQHYEAILAQFESRGGLTYPQVCERVFWATQSPAELHRKSYELYLDEYLSSFTQQEQAAV